MAHSRALHMLTTTAPGQSRDDYPGASVATARETGESLFVYWVRVS